MWRDQAQEWYLDWLTYKASGREQRGGETGGV